MVDQIPYPARNDLKSISLDTASQLRGAEGISLMVGRSEAIAPDLWSSHDSHGEREKLPENQHGSLFFQCGKSDDGFRSLYQDECLVRYRSLLELPVANTVFHNGQRSTFFAQRWALKRSKVLKPELQWKPELQFVKHQDLKLQRVIIPDLGFRLEESFLIPSQYRPLTIPQTVATSMGNIISQFQTGGDSGMTEPASLQLEQAISLAPTLQGTSHEIWARVIPREFWPDRPHMLRSLDEAFQNGHRLHKVLSGGGGWGNKRGLLSLDPDSTFNESSSELGLAREYQDNCIAEGRDMLGEIVRPGDVVDLWIRYPRGDDLLRRPRFPDSSSPLLISSPEVSVCFGHNSYEEESISNTRQEETLSENLENKNLRKVTSQYLVFKEYFGAISTTGMSLHIQSISPNQESTYGSLKLGTILKSKIPPGGHFRFQSGRMNLSVEVMDTTTSSIASPVSEVEANQDSSLSSISSDPGLRLRKVSASSDKSPQLRIIKFDETGPINVQVVERGPQISHGNQKRRHQVQDTGGIDIDDRSREGSRSSTLANKLRAKPQLRLEDALQALSVPEIKKSGPQEVWEHFSSSEPVPGADTKPAESPDQKPHSSSNRAPSNQADTKRRSESPHEPRNFNSAQTPSESASEILAFLRDVNAEKEALMSESEEFFEGSNFRPERENLGKPSTLGGVDKRSESMD